MPAVVEAFGLGVAGLAATDKTIAAAARHNLDLRESTSRRLDVGALIAVDLALGMERGHVRAATVMEPSIWPQTFTLRELVRRAEAVGARGADESLDAWLARVHEGREARDLLGESPDDDVTDPTGGTTAEHEDLALELEELVDRLVLLAWPDA